MVRFDDVCFTRCGSSGFDHVWVDGALRQPFHVFQAQRLFVEHFNKHAANDFTFGFRIVFARQCGQEALFAFNVNNVQTEMVAEHVHHLLGFVQAQQTIVHEDAGQVFADGTVQQHRGHGGVNATGQAEDHFIVADLFADTLNGIVDDFRWGPQRFTLADIANEAVQHTHTLTGVGHFRVELHAVEAFFFVRHNGKRAAFGAGNGYEIGRNRGHFIAVAHPDVEQRFAFSGQGIFDPANQGAVGQYFDLRVTKFTLVRGLNVAAQLHRHGLHAVAHAKYRNASFKHILRCAWAVVLGGAFRAAGKNDAAWVEFTDLCFRDIPCPKFTVNAEFAHATCHQLCVLRTEIQDKNAMFMNVFHY
ncbi:hypothetical protein D3C72_636770 [compost metagenome]